MKEGSNSLFDSTSTKTETLADQETGDFQKRKATTTPQEHLEHLLKIGWSPNSFIIKRFCKTYGLKA